jgi:hypothetical protein
MDTITELQQALCLKAHLANYKHSEVHGQRPNTHARTLLDRAQEQVDMIAHLYCVAQQAYFQLRGAGKWESILKVLHSQDLCVITDPQESTQNNQLSEGYCTLSWIWLSTGHKAGSNHMDTPEMHEGLSLCMFLNPLLMSFQLYT